MLLLGMHVHLGMYPCTCTWVELTAPPRRAHTILRLGTCLCTWACMCAWVELTAPPRRAHTILLLGMHVHLGEHVHLRLGMHLHLGMHVHEVEVEVEGRAARCCRSRGRSCGRARRCG